jgi:hypothetical protein
MIGAVGVASRYTGYSVVHGSRAVFNSAQRDSTAC